MADEDAVRRAIAPMFDEPTGDVVHARELYRDDAVLEFPQSGERFEGPVSFTAWRAQYPSEVTLSVRDVTVREDLAVVEEARQHLIPVVE